VPSLTRALLVSRCEGVGGIVIGSCSAPTHWVPKARSSRPPLPGRDWPFLVGALGFHPVGKFAGSVLVEVHRRRPPAGAGCDCAGCPSLARLPGGGGEQRDVPAINNAPATNPIVRCSEVDS